jgi:hypothetical protein
MIYFKSSCFIKTCVPVSRHFTHPHKCAGLVMIPVTVDLPQPCQIGLPVKKAPSLFHSKHSTKGKAHSKAFEASVRTLNLCSFTSSFVFSMANSIDDDVAEDPNSGFTTRGHEAERTADGSEFNASSDYGRDRYKEQGRILRARLEDMASWAGQPAIKGSSESMRMALLTFSIIGLQ